MISDHDMQQWKVLRPKCIDRFCQTTFELIHELMVCDDSLHDRHRRLCQLVSRRDTELTQKLDPHPRSTKCQLLNLYRDDLIKDTDLEQFSEGLCTYLIASKAGSVSV